MLRSIVARTLRATKTGVGTAKSVEKRGFLSLADIASKLCVVSVADVHHRHSLHTSLAMAKVEDRKEMLGSMPKRDEGTEGEVSIDIDAGVR
ncbi:hypothetical protein SK128_026700, partial [Halocaridina rubra]